MKSDSPPLARPRSASSAPRDGLFSPRSLATLSGYLLLCTCIALLGGLSTAAGVAEWYPTLDKPPWTPPNWAFGPVWTVLYILIALAGWDLTRRTTADDRTPLVVYAAQLFLNLIWSPLFFSLHRVWTALAVISVLWWLVAESTRLFARHSRLAALAMWPYLAWLTVAWSLNAWIALHNA